MKTKGILYLLALLLLNACYKVQPPEKPERLLSEDEMVAVLVDMAIVSSAKGVNKKRFENNGIIPDEYIYKKNNIDSLLFVQNNEYYSFNIKKYESIYIRVKDSLTKLRDKYKLIEEAEKKAKDDSVKAKRKQTSLKLEDKAVKKSAFQNKKSRVKPVPKEPK
ncbi:DUF4296 domain-containing protein [Pontimicrobium sp. MEBiC06410]|jgi:hypothetical protein